MKRTPLKRKTPLKSKTPLRRGKFGKAKGRERTPMQVEKDTWDRIARECDGYARKITKAQAKHRCEECRTSQFWFPMRLEHHHIISCGSKYLRWHPLNRSAVCTKCHGVVHACREEFAKRLGGERWEWFQENYRKVAPLSKPRIEEMYEIRDRLKAEWEAMI